MYVLRILLWIWLSLVGRCGRTVSLHSARMCALPNSRVVGPRLGHTVQCFALEGSRLGHLAEAVTIVPHPSVDIV